MTFPNRGQFATRRPPVAPKAAEPTPDELPGEELSADSDSTAAEQAQLEDFMTEQDDDNIYPEPEEPEEPADSEADIPEEPASGEDTTSGDPAATEPQSLPKPAATEPPKPTKATPKTRARNTARKNADKTPGPGQATLIVIENGAITCSSEQTVIIDLDKASAEDTDAHQIVDLITGLRQSVDEPLRDATLTSLTALIAKKAMGN